MATTLDAQPLSALYRATAAPQLVVVPRLSFLAVDGHGDPNTAPAYAACLQALYAVSYGAKFAIKRAGGEEFKVSPLEGLWWAEDPAVFATGEKSDWDWTMMIRQPAAVTVELVEQVADHVAEKKSLPIARALRFESFEEGSAAQVLHVGPYSTEAPTITRLHEFITERGLTFDGRVQKHHEIYLGDPRRAAPEKLRTIIRQPYQRP